MGPPVPQAQACQSPDSRKSQNTELQEASGEVKEAGAAGQCVLCLMQSFPGPRDPRPQIPPLSHTPSESFHLLPEDGSSCRLWGTSGKDAGEVIQA